MTEMQSKMPTIHTVVSYKSPHKEIFCSFSEKQEDIEWLFDISERFYIDARDLMDLFPSHVDTEGRQKLQKLDSNLENVDPLSASHSDYVVFDLCTTLSKQYSLDLHSGGFLFKSPLIGTFLVVTGKEYPHQSIFLPLKKVQHIDAWIQNLESLHDLYFQGKLPKIKQDSHYIHWVSGSFLIGVGWQKKEVV